MDALPKRGRGRPPRPGYTAYSLVLNTELMQAFDELSKSLGITRSQAVDDILMGALPAIRFQIQLIEDAKNLPIDKRQEFIDSLNNKVETLSVALESAKQMDLLDK